MKKKVFCWLLVLLIGLGGIALAETEFSYEERLWPERPSR